MAFPADMYYMVEGYWLQLSGVDLQGEWTDFDPDNNSANGKCYLKVKPINAAFNILGSQAYIGYYIEHNYVNNTMKFTPHQFSVKKSLEPSKRPQGEFAIVYQT